MLIWSMILLGAVLVGLGAYMTFRKEPDPELEAVAKDVDPDDTEEIVTEPRLDAEGIGDFFEDKPQAEQSPAAEDVRAFIPDPEHVARRRLQKIRDRYLDTLEADVPLVHWLIPGQHRIDLIRAVSQANAELRQSGKE